MRGVEKIKELYCQRGDFDLDLSAMEVPIIKIVIGVRDKGGIRKSYK